jgi:hypothetical protein
VQHLVWQQPALGPRFAFVDLMPKLDSPKFDIRAGQVDVVVVYKIDRRYE